jgi:transcriptional regulator with XRE-family HTH domain
MRNKVKRQIRTSLDSQAIGRRIRELRGFDLKQSEFGKILGVGQAQLSKYEKGEALPRLDVLLKLRAYSGRSIDWIITGTDAGQDS